jgi:F-type H+-transporting ATPase subunit a
MMLASNPLEEVLDQPWRLHGQVVPWLSNQIASIIIVGLLLMIVLPLLTRRHRGLVPHGGYRLVEMFLLFVREQIANKAMGPLARAWTPFLATLLAFLLGLNLFGLIPLKGLTIAAGLRDTPVGGAATGSIYVTGALASLSFLLVMLTSYWQSVNILWKGPAHGHGQEKPGHSGHPVRAGANVILAVAQALQRRAWPLPVALLAGVLVWLNRFVPPVSGVIGLVLWPVLLVLEMLGYVTRCFALCIRLFANMISGHILIAVLLLLASQGTGFALLYASLPAGLGVLAILALEVLVALIHAYIFTFLSALFIGLAANPQH